MGGVEHRPIAGEVRLAGEHVHGLGAGDARQQFQGEGGDVGGGVSLEAGGRAVGREDAEQECARLHQRQFVDLALAGQQRTLHLEHDVGVAEQRRRFINEGGPGLGIGGVGEAGSGAGSALDRHAQAQCLEFLHGFRRGRDSPFAGPPFLGYGDFHALLVLVWPHPRRKLPDPAPRCSKFRHLRQFGAGLSPPLPVPPRSILPAPR